MSLLCLERVKLTTRGPAMPPTTMKEVKSLETFADLSSTLAEGYNSALRNHNPILRMVFYTDEDPLEGQALCDKYVSLLAEGVVSLSEHKASKTFYEMAVSEPEHFFLKDMYCKFAVC